MTVAEAKRWQNSPDPSVRAAARARLAAKKAHDLRLSPRKAPGREKKHASRMERVAHTYRVRLACVERAGGKCETCGNEASPDYPLQMHHLLPGRGRRTQEQAPENCVMVCMWCHEFGHSGRILYVGPGLLEWAERHGYREARDAVRRRMDKALLADPAWPRDADELARLGPPHPSPAREGETTP